MGPWTVALRADRRTIDCRLAKRFNCSSSRPGWALVNEWRLEGMKEEGAGEPEALLPLLPAPNDMDKEDAKLSQDRSWLPPPIAPISPSPDDPVKVETGLALDEEDRPLDRLCELYNRSCRTVRIDGEGLFLPLSSLRLRLDAHMILQDCGEEAGLLLLLLLSGFRIPAGTCCCGGNLRRMNGDPSGDPVSCTVLGFSDPAGLIKRLQRGLGTLGRSDAKDSSEEDPSRTATNLLTATPGEQRGQICCEKRQE